jgi:hypothetical protein
MAISLLNRDSLKLICSFLTRKDVCAMVRVSKEWEKIGDIDVIWHMQGLKLWPLKLPKEPSQGWKAWVMHPTMISIGDDRIDVVKRIIYNDSYSLRVLDKLAGKILCIWRIRTAGEAHFRDSPEGPVTLVRIFDGRYLCSEEMKKKLVDPSLVQWTIIREEIPAEDLW